ncbi:reverse transcriptase domain-containing protein [Tanacetum coccineum]
MVPATTSLSVRSTSPFNGIIGRPGLRKIKAVPSTTHGMIKFPVMGGTLTLKRYDVRIQGNSKHKLNVRKGCQPVRQKKRGQAAERNVAINDEVSKLVKAGIMKEVHYHDWLSNSVMVKKSDNCWRMCVDFKDLNKACPKDGYPLPEIDWKVKSLCGFPFKCFLDAYKGYHQIQMAEEDEEKTVFITNQAKYLCLTATRRTRRNSLSKLATSKEAEWKLQRIHGVEYTTTLRFQFETTNNKAEYEALIAELRIAEKMGIKNLEVNVDSKLVANQVNGTYIAKETDMIKYLEKVKVLVEELKEKSVNEGEVLVVVEEEGDTWMTPIHEYLMDETLPQERKKLRRPSQANYVLREIHEDSCSMHAGTRFIVAKALRTGYYWPTMHKDARALIKACQECQVHKPVPRNQREKLNLITSPWPFYKWGIDIAGLFPEGPDKVKFLIVDMDYFTKWIEAKPVATITGNQVKKFVWELLSNADFGHLRRIITDNQGTIFEINPFRMV